MNNYNIIDYSSLVLDYEIIPSWRELIDESLPLPQQFLSLLKRTTILPKDFYRIVVAYAFLPSVLAKVVPYLFLHGCSGSGKSNTVKLLSWLHGGKINSSTDSFAGIRNHLQERKYATLYTFGDGDNPGTYREGIEQNCALFWEDIDPQVFQKYPDLYRLFKVGYDSSTSKIQISSEKTGKNLKFDCFCPKVFSSIHSFHTDYNYPEFRRRLIVIPTQKVEEINGFETSELISLEDYNFSSLEEDFKKYWDLSRSSEYLGLRKEIRPKIKFRSDRKQVVVDLITTGLMTDIWQNIAHAQFDLEAYFLWFDKEIEQEQDLLERHLLKLIRDTENESKELGKDESVIWITSLRTKVLSWYEQGILDEPANRKRVREIIKSKGYKNTGNGAWRKKL